MTMTNRWGSGGGAFSQPAFTQPNAAVFASNSPLTGRAEDGHPASDGGKTSTR